MDAFDRAAEKSTKSRSWIFTTPRLPRLRDQCAATCSYICRTAESRTCQPTVERHIGNDIIKNIHLLTHRRTVLLSFDTLLALSLWHIENAFALIGDPWERGYVGVVPFEASQRVRCGDCRPRWPHSCVEIWATHLMCGDLGDPSDVWRFGPPIRCVEIWAGRSG